MNLLTASDDTIFEKAKESDDNVILITKDEDFIDLVLRKKPPPRIVWITAGNISNNQLRQILLGNFQSVVELLDNTDYSFIEIS